MKTILFVLISALMAAVACNRQESENVDTWWVNSAKVSCTGSSEMSCLQIQKGDQFNADDWEFFYSSIEGFTYEPGNIYQIKVKSTPKDNVPADGSSLNYQLVKVLSKEADSSLNLTNIWKVTSVENIEDPKNEQTDETLLFEFNASEKTFLGDTGCNSVSGEIKENDGQKLTLSPGAATMMACPDMKAERAISQALIDTRSFKMEENHLYLMNEAGKTIITFQAVD
jgi:heat shock protein HslJ